MGFSDICVESSTVSSVLNSLAAICLEDFVRPFCLPHMSDARATNVSKILAVLYGILCFGLVFIVANLGNVLELALSIYGIVGGALLGVFTLGMFFPWANAKVASILVQALRVSECGDSEENFCETAIGSRSGHHRRSGLHALGRSRHSGGQRPRLPETRTQALQ